jgi:hypothetical protein
VGFGDVIDDDWTGVVVEVVSGLGAVFVVSWRGVIFGDEGMRFSIWLVAVCVDQEK